MEDAFSRLANALEPPRRRDPEPVVVAAVPKKKPRGDTSRDHAVYAAPHRPSVPPRLDRRAADVTTKRILRELNAAAATAPKGLGTVTIAFIVTVALGLAGMSAFAFLR